MLSLLTFLQCLPGVKFTLEVDGYAVCNECKERMKPGPGGIANLEIRHWRSKGCRERKARNARTKPNQSILGFLKPKPTPVPQKTSAPAMVQGNSNATGVQSMCMAATEPFDRPVKPAGTQNPLQMRISSLPNSHFLQKLAQLIQKLPDSVPEATADDNLSVFACDPAQGVDPALGPDELWEESVNGTLKRHLGWGTEAAQEDLIRRGKFGMDGLLNFAAYFVLERGVDAGLFEGKLASLMESAEKL